MIIHWNVNPLRTEIDLNDDEKLLFKEKIRVDQMKHIIWSASFYLDKGKDYYSEEKALEELKAFDDEDAFNEQIDKYYNYYLESLQEVHVGDCTCVPCSCEKCHAEFILGTDTIKGLGKHSAYKIDGLFWDKETKSYKELTPKEALEKINTPRDYSESRETFSKWVDKDWQDLVDRWERERQHAASWLENYYKEKGML